ncbi:MAG: hypothetical protein OSA97_08705 [Nevskia sp.]|nr:hypothetical protein [Nevskia sp.]
MSPVRGSKPGDKAFERTIELVDWACKEGTDGQRYLVGARPGGTGHVSAPLAEFYPDNYIACTHSGLIYGLIGPPGRSVAGEQLWAAFMAANGIQELEK